MIIRLSVERRPHPVPKERIEDARTRGSRLSAKENLYLLPPEEANTRNKNNFLTIDAPPLSEACKRLPLVEKSVA